MPAEFILWVCHFGADWVVLCYGLKLPLCMLVLEPLGRVYDAGQVQMLPVLSLEVPLRG